LANRKTVLLAQIQGGSRRKGGLTVGEAGSTKRRWEDKAGWGEKFIGVKYTG